MSPATIIKPLIDESARRTCSRSRSHAWIIVCLSAVILNLSRAPSELPGMTDDRRELSREPAMMCKFTRDTIRPVRKHVNVNSKARRQYLCRFLLSPLSGKQKMICDLGSEMKVVRSAVNTLVTVSLCVCQFVSKQSSDMCFIHASLTSWKHTASTCFIKCSQSAWKGDTGDLTLATQPREGPRQHTILHRSRPEPIEVPDDEAQPPRGRTRHRPSAPIPDPIRRVHARVCKVCVCVCEGVSASVSASACACAFLCSRGAPGTPLRGGWRLDRWSHPYYSPATCF